MTNDQNTSLKKKIPLLPKPLPSLGEKKLNCVNNHPKKKKKKAKKCDENMNWLGFLTMYGHLYSQCFGICITLVLDLL